MNDHLMSMSMDKAMAAAAAAVVSEKMPDVDLAQAGQLALVPDGYSVQSLADFQTRPNRTTCKPLFFEAEALGDYVNRFRTAATVAFQDWKTASLTAIFDYSEASSEDFAAGSPGWCAHAATFKARETPAWAAWSGMHDKLVGQLSFARFLEERAHEIVEPDAASVVDVCMSFDAIKKVDFKSSVRLHDGFRQFVYVEDNEARGAVSVPEVITVNVPIFEGQEPVRVKLRLRYRMDDGKLLLGLSIDNLDEIVKAAFARCLDTFATTLTVEIPIYAGTP